MKQLIVRRLRTSHDGTVVVPMATASSEAEAGRYVQEEAAALQEAMSARVVFGPGACSMAVRDFLASLGIEGISVAFGPYDLEDKGVALPAVTGKLLL